MNMDQLFKQLPRDLQWEILETFVGTHIVRNGKLMRKMTGHIHNQFANEQSGGGIWIKQQPTYLPLGTWVAYDGICFNTNVILSMNPKMNIYLWENLYNREITYCYHRYAYLSPSYKYVLDDTIILSAYKKNVYPSYPFTDKKLGRPRNKAALFINK